jgi:hypothetical protein
MMELARSESRFSERANLFVMAAIFVGLASEPVKMRNLSPDGALIEGASLPQLGTKVRLCRANLEVDGEIMWCVGGRAGLRFQSPVVVADWLPAGSAKVAQQRVDQLVQKFKHVGRNNSPSSATIAEIDGKRIDQVELVHLKAAIESLAEDLAADPAIVERHWSKLQTLDIVGQALGKLAEARR